MVLCSAVHVEGAGAVGRGEAEVRDDLLPLLLPDVAGQLQLPVLEVSHSPDKPRLGPDTRSAAAELVRHSEEDHGWGLDRHLLR